MRSLFAIAVTLVVPAAPGTGLAQTPPECRLDDEGAAVVAATIRLATKASARLGEKFPFDNVVANPRTPSTTPDTVVVYVVQDASLGGVDKDHCPIGGATITDGEALDPVSVRGGCVAAAGRMEVKCSSHAVRTFGRQGERPGSSNPALLYVVAHELGHLMQRLPGEYAGRVDTIDLAQPQTAKLEALRESCEPGLTKAEEDADRTAVRLLEAMVADPPYREPLFSPQGSMLWAVDQLNLATSQWRESTLAREFISRPEPHKSFVPTEFPTPADTVLHNARTFVCQVLTKNRGVIHYPGRSATHPPLEVRMQRVAEALRSVAAGLPKTGAQQQYDPVPRLQEQLSDITSFMYRETGVYLEAVQSAVCTRVNSDDPLRDC